MERLKQASGPIFFFFVKIVADNSALDESMGI